MLKKSGRFDTDLCCQKQKNRMSLAYTQPILEPLTAKKRWIFLKACLHCCHTLLKINWYKLLLPTKTLEIDTKFQQTWVSCPLLALRLGEYWFRISHYVYDCNRPLAPIRRQRQCSLMYDVCLTCIDDDDEQVLHVLLERDRNTWNTIQDQNWIFFSWTMNNEKQKNRMENRKMNKI